MTEYDLSRELATLRAEIEALRGRIEMVRQTSGDDEVFTSFEGSDFFMTPTPGGGSGVAGEFDIDANAIVTIGVDYVTSQSDEDFGPHPYAIRIRRGRLQLVNGVLKVVEDTDLKRFIDTVKHSDLGGSS